MEEGEAEAIKWGEKMVRKSYKVTKLRRTVGLSGLQVTRLCQQEGELEIELETERRRLADASKSYRKAVRGEE